MTATGSKLICALLAMVFVAGLSAQSYGFGTIRIASDDCCCQSEPAVELDSACGDSETTCCPGDSESSQESDSPCSCVCSGCSLMVRSLNLYSAETDLALLFTQDAERLITMPTQLPASASLGVDIQPPIA